MAPKITTLLTLFICFSTLKAQHHTTANAHSHNDYEQAVPFQLAFEEGFGSIEADVFLVGKDLWVAHDKKDLDSNNTLERLYLKQIQAVDLIRPLQLLIDIKTESIETLNALIEILNRYPDLKDSKYLKLVISGNRPPADQFTQYPDYISFDGRLGVTYTKEQLKKIALISEDYNKIVGWNRSFPLKDSLSSIIQSTVAGVHALGKPFRFWASPDYPIAWDQIIKCGVDYINTDHIHLLSDFLQSRDSSKKELPYQRTIQSAGKVIRFGNPNLENHALDLAVMDTNGLVAIEERYGIYILDLRSNKIIDKWLYEKDADFKGFNSTYSGIKVFKNQSGVYLTWSAASRGSSVSSLMFAKWDNGIKDVFDFRLNSKAPIQNAIPNEVVVNQENGKSYLYVVLNGTNRLLKWDWETRILSWDVPTGEAPYGVAISNGKCYVTHWGGPNAIDSTRERAGIPWGLVYTDPRTGATAEGTVGVYALANGERLNEMQVGLHPNAVIASKKSNLIYVANGSSDHVSVIDTKLDAVVETIQVGLFPATNYLQGSTPNALLLDATEEKLYVANGMDNAIAVIGMGEKVGSTKKPTVVQGYIPTEAFPAGIAIVNNQLVVANLESQGANVVDAIKKARSIHHQLASVSTIPLPTEEKLMEYTQLVRQFNRSNSVVRFNSNPNKKTIPTPIPQKIGDPSVFKHVVYIIKENKTYDQVLGDMPEGNGDSSLCSFGKKITPNTHALAKQFGLMDDFYVSGKSSAEGHQWTDAGIVSDYVEKNIRAWFRSYPHRQEDAMVYSPSGFIWNHVADFGKTIKVYGEACTSVVNPEKKWIDLYRNYKSGVKPIWKNETTINRLNSMIHPTYPDCDNMVFSDQQRADLFIEDWNQMEKENRVPNLMVLSLPNDHAAGLSPDFPTPYAMVADNDLALGRIIETISKSKSWDSTVIFVTEDDSQGGWDHVSAYRSVALVISPYSNNTLISSKYNQVSILRTIEHILGVPPMNSIDASARLMTDCFQKNKKVGPFTAVPNEVPLDQMNKPLLSLRGKEKRMAILSQNELFNEVDGGKDDQMNRIIWYYAFGKRKYPLYVK